MAAAGGPEADPLISAALIVRNEEHHLTDCLESIADVVDEVVVVDTGSVDRTPAIAEAHGARLFHEPWRDDFAYARNHALERCRGRWVLYIDADERLRPTDRSRLEQVLSEPGAVGATVTLHPVEGFTGYRELRLFRNDPRIRFKGLIHETIWPGVLEVLEADGAHIGETDVVVDHVGYHGDQDHKHDRNLPLLLKALDEDPDQIYCWFHLGQTYMGLGRRDDARAAWCSGIAAIHRSPHLRPADSLPYIELISDLLADEGAAPDLIAEARARFPDDPMLRWQEARADMLAGRLDAAVAVFDDLIEAERAGALSRDFGYAPGHFTTLTHVLAGDCEHQLGRYERAARHFEWAESYEPDNLEFRVKRQLNEHLAG